MRYGYSARFTIFLSTLFIFHSGIYRIQFVNIEIDYDYNCRCHWFHIGGATEMKRRRIFGCWVVM